MLCYETRGPSHGPEPGAQAELVPRQTEASDQLPADISVHNPDPPHVRNRAHWDHAFRAMFCCLVKLTHTRTQFPSFPRFRFLRVGVVFSLSIMCFFIRNREKDEDLSFQS